MQNGYATIRPTCAQPLLSLYDAKRYLLAGVVHYVVPSVIAGTAFFVLWWLVKGRRA